MRNHEHAHAMRHKAKPAMPYLGKFLGCVVDDVVNTSFYFLLSCCAIVQQFLVSRPKGICQEAVEQHVYCMRTPVLRRRKEDAAVAMQRHGAPGQLCPQDTLALSQRHRAMLVYRLQQVLTSNVLSQIDNAYATTT